MDKALVFGTKDCRFESCQGHLSRAPHVSASASAYTSLRSRSIGNSRGAARQPTCQFGSDAHSMWLGTP
jgi:hypothetical protein